MALENVKRVIKSPEITIVLCAAESFSQVLNKDQVMLFCELDNFVNIEISSINITDHDCFCLYLMLEMRNRREYLFSDGCFNVFKSGSKSVKSNIYWNCLIAMMSFKVNFDLHKTHWLPDNCGHIWDIDGCHDNFRPKREISSLKIS